MNTQLVDSLVQVILSLPVEERTLLEEKLATVNPTETSPNRSWTEEAVEIFLSLGQDAVPGQSITSLPATIASFVATKMKCDCVTRLNSSSTSQQRRVNMPPLPTPALPSSQIVRREAIDVLVKQLRIAKATMFLGETLWQPTDYLQIKQQLFVGETVDSLYGKILSWRASSPTPDVT